MAAKEISVKKYVVRLSGEERERLETLLRKGKSPARRVLKARILHPRKACGAKRRRRSSASHDPNLSIRCDRFDNELLPVMCWLELLLGGRNVVENLYSVIRRMRLPQLALQSAPERYPTGRMSRA